MIYSSRTWLSSLAFFVALNGCGQPTSSAGPDAYIENGVMWAYGSVQLAELDGPASLVLRRGTPVQGVDSWTVSGTMPGGDERDLAYIDYHPTLDRLLAYSYQVDAVRRATYGEDYDVYAVLKKPGRSYYQRQFVFLGVASFNGGDSAPLQLGDGLKISLIANGVFSGQWALHYPDVQKIVVKPWQGMCPKLPTEGPGQSPGQNPGQNPGQIDVCRPLPPEKDLCGGDPTQAACRPEPPVQQLPGGTGGSADPAPSRTTSGLEAQGQGVYVMNADVKEAKLVFVSERATAASDEENTDLCAKKFYAVARTVNGRVNDACVLTPAPATRVDNKLTCGMTVRFDRAETYLERVCDVTAVFMDGDVQRAQILKK